MNPKLIAQQDSDLDAALDKSRAAYAEWRAACGKGDDVGKIAKGKGLIIKSRPAGGMWAALSERLAKSKVTGTMSAWWEAVKSSVTGGK